MARKKVRSVFQDLLSECLSLPHRMPQTRPSEEVERVMGIEPTLPGSPASTCSSGWQPGPG